FPHDQWFDLLGAGKETNGPHLGLVQHNPGRSLIESADRRELLAVARNLHLTAIEQAPPVDPRKYLDRVDPLGLLERDRRVIAAPGAASRLEKRRVVAIEGKYGIEEIAGAHRAGEVGCDLWFDWHLQQFADHRIERLETRGKPRDGHLVVG